MDNKNQLENALEFRYLEESLSLFIKNPSFHLSWVEKQFILIVKYLDNLQWFKEVRKDLPYFCHVKNNYHGVVESSRYTLLHKTYTFTKQNDHCINWFSVDAIKYQDKTTQGRKSLFQFTVPEGWSPPWKQRLGNHKEGIVGEADWLISLSCVHRKVK